MSVQSSEMMSSEVAGKAAIAVSGTEVATQLAQSTYEGLRRGGLSDTDIMAFAGELLALVAAGVRAMPDAE